MFGYMYVRGTDGSICWVAYRENGILDVNGDFMGSGIGVNWVADVAQYFELTIDMDAKTVSLSIDGSPVALVQNYPFSDHAGIASNIWRMSFQLGYTTEHAYAVDDMMICGGLPLGVPEFEVSAALMVSVVLAGYLLSKKFSILKPRI